MIDYINECHITAFVLYIPLLSMHSCELRVSQMIFFTVFKISVGNAKSQNRNMKYPLHFPVETLVVNLNDRLPFFQDESDDREIHKVRFLFELRFSGTCV